MLSAESCHTRASAEEVTRVEEYIPGGNELLPKVHKVFAGVCVSMEKDVIGASVLLLQHHLYIIPKAITNRTTKENATIQHPKPLP